MLEPVCAFTPGSERLGRQPRLRRGSLAAAVARLRAFGAERSIDSKAPGGPGNDVEDAEWPEDCCGFGSAPRRPALAGALGVCTWSGRKGVSPTSTARTQPASATGHPSASPARRGAKNRAERISAVAEARATTPRRSSKSAAMASAAARPPPHPFGWDGRSLRAARGDCGRSEQACQAMP